MPVLDVNGRARSTQTGNEYWSGMEAMLESMSEEEREVALSMFGGAGDFVVGRLAESHYDRTPVDPITFLNSPDYWGHVGGTMWPKLQDDFAALFDGGYSECVMGGSLGYGKTFFATCGLAYIFYQMTCLKDPLKSYGLSTAGQPVTLALLSRTMQTARRTLLTPFWPQLQMSPYFREEAKVKSQLTENTIKCMTKPVILVASSSSGGVIGGNVFGAFIDESSYFQQTKSVGRDGKVELVDHAETAYNAIIRRMKSRFQRSGKLPGVFFLASSKERPNTFIERRVSKAMSEGDDTVFVREYATWDVKPADNFSGETFKIALGNERYRAILDPTPEQIALYEEAGLRTIEVPVDYRKEFEADLESSLRDIAGVATHAVSPYMQRVDQVARAFRPGLPKAVSDELVTGARLEIEWNRIAEPFQRTLPGGVLEQAWRPRRNPEAMRFIHIDPALTGDGAGFVMGHIAKMIEVARRDADGKEYTEIAPVIETDFVTRVKAASGDEIELGFLRALVYSLIEHGFPVARVTLDSFQSADTIQQLRSRGIDAEVVSVDKTTEPYDTLKQAIYEDRVRVHDNQILRTELVQLQRVLRTSGNGYKVDHPKVGGCFVGETRIPLLDGTIPTIAEMEGREAWVYSCTTDGRIVPGLARGRMTKMTTELVDVVLDSGAVARCTPEHRWMLRDGSYKEARDLVPAVDRLMPIGRAWPVDGGYEKVVDAHGARVQTHRMVWTWFNGKIPDGHVIHHVNHVKTDNRPENLELAGLVEHARSHTLKMHDDPEYRKKLSLGTIRFNRLPDTRAKRSAFIRSMPKEWYAERARKNGNFRHDVDMSTLRDALVSGPMNANRAARKIGCGRNTVMRVLREHGFSSWDEFALKERSEPGDNYKVRAVIPVVLDAPVPVYDLEVDEHHNFALSAGVFVHNSKDISDALCGVVFGLVKKPPAAPMAAIVEIGAVDSKRDEAMSWVAGSRGTVGPGSSSGRPMPKPVIGPTPGLPFMRG